MNVLGLSFILLLDYGVAYLVPNSHFVLVLELA